MEILKTSKVSFEYPVAYGIDLQSEHEKYLTEIHFKKPVILHDYPKTIKPFYMRLNADQQTVAAMDILVPGIGEIVGGSQREERLDVLEARMDEMGLVKRKLLVVSGFQAIWIGAAQRIWHGIRAADHDDHRNHQYPRCHSISQNAGKY